MNRVGAFFIIFKLLKCEDELANGFTSLRQSKWTYGLRCFDDEWIYCDFLKVICVWTSSVNDCWDIQSSNFKCLNYWVVKIFCIWISVRLTEPKALVYDVNTKETRSKILYNHFDLPFEWFCKDVSRRKIFWDSSEHERYFTNWFEIFRVSQKTSSIWENIFLGDFMEKYY